MSFPKFIIEGKGGFFSRLTLGISIIILIIIANIFLYGSIKTNKNKLILNQRQTRTKFSQTTKLDGNCPETMSGNPKAYLKIKYFYSPVCFWCILEDKNLDEILQEEGQAFSLEKYERENCENIMQRYKLSLTPGFVFSTSDNSKEYTVDGYISKENLIKIICDVTGYCIKSDNKPSPESIPKSQKVKIYFK